MSRVLLFAGTTEGRELAEFLERQGVVCDVCVATEYGQQLLDQKMTGHRIYTGRLTMEEMSDLMRSTAVDLTVDATHPYATVVSDNIRGACRNTGCTYLRLLRDVQETEGQCVFVETVEEAVNYLAGTTGNILAATGSKELEKYTALPDYKERVFARRICGSQCESWISGEEPDLYAGTFRGRTELCHAKTGKRPVSRDKRIGKDRWIS